MAHNSAIIGEYVGFLKDLSVSPKILTYDPVLEMVVLRYDLIETTVDLNLSQDEQNEQQPGAHGELGHHCDRDQARTPDAVREDTRHHAVVCEERLRSLAEEQENQVADDQAAYDAHVLEHIAELQSLF